jgi:hypothetical protein
VVTSEETDYIPSNSIGAIHTLEPSGSWEELDSNVAKNWKEKRSAYKLSIIPGAHSVCRLTKNNIHTYTTVCHTRLISGCLRPFTGGRRRTLLRRMARVYMQRYCTKGAGVRGVCRVLISREPVERRTTHGMPSAR